MLLAVLVAVPVGIALLHEGFPSVDVRMDSRDVWVTNTDDVMAGRLNAQIHELDGSVSLTGSDVLVLQHGDDVFLHDRGSGALGRVDPAYTDLRESILTPAGSVSAYGGGVLAVLDPADGRLWTIDARGGLSFDASTQAPALELGPGAQLVVTERGTVLAVAPAEAAVYRIAGLGAEPTRATIALADGEGAAALRDYELTAVGERAVVLDRVRNAVLLEGGTEIALPEAGVRIQQPGADADGVLVATPTGLARVTFAGDARLLEPRVPYAGTHVAQLAAPVQLGGCAYGAWAGPRVLTMACEGAAGETHQIPQDIAGEITFRVNRDVIVLNDVRGGNVWLPQEDMRLVENWQDTVPPEDADGTDGENEATEQSFEDTLAERTDENHPPELRDDRFGVRPGSVAPLAVLDNDTDPDGDLITITELVGEVPASLGEVRIVDEGRGLQFQASEGAAGEITLGYRGSDGRPGGIAEAKVTIEIVPGTVENRAPVMRHVATVSVEAGQQLPYNVLGDWSDPDGDVVYLLAATAPEGMAVSSAPDGRLTVTAVGAELGTKTVNYTVSDGTSQASGQLTVEIAAPQSMSPVGTPDYARGVAGAIVTAEPLVNDLSPSGAPLSVVEIAELDGGGGGATFNPDLGTVSYRTSTPGTYYVQYTVSSGTHDSIGLIRFDVLDAAAASGEITAVRDVGFLRPGQPATIAALSNDMSMGDAVLSIQSVEVSDEARVAGVAVELIDNTLVRATSQEALLGPLEVPYTITDGARSATGTIVLVPVEPIVNRQQPIAVDDSRKVRVGDFTSVDVLANDVHPDDVAMTVSPVLSDLDLGGGLAFVTGNQVRFQAPAEPGTYSLAYTVTDDYGEQGGARVTFQVAADDEASNRPPEPTAETARVFEGASILVQVPLTGVDPDGDSVTFAGVVGAPTLGSIREENQTSFVYEAFPGAAGTDTIRYAVVDTYGQRAEGVLRVGVVPRGGQTVPPVAIDDAVVARPGATIAVPVLANDSDPNGATVAIVPDFTGVDPALAAEVDGDAVLLTVPSDAPFVIVPYSITNGRGGTATAWITVTVSEEAPLLPPGAIDQVVPTTAFDGATSFDVDPRVGARNPTGRVADLDVALVGTNAEAATVLADGSVRVTPSDRRQVIAYTLSSPETGLHATAFIMVPGVVTDDSKRQSPFLRPELPEQVTPVGTAMAWNVADLVVAPSGNAVTVIEPQAAWAEQGDGSPVVVSDSRVQFTPKPGFRGPASITFLVTDAVGPNDANAGVATIRLRVTVGDPNMFDVPPTFVTPQVQVEAGTTKSIDLRAATGHPNPAVVAQVSYSGLSGMTPALTAALSGSTLSVTPTLGTPSGTIVPLEVTYSFRGFTQTGTVNVTVVSSSKPPPRAVDDSHAARRGEVVTMDVLANDVNPFPERPLRLLEAVDQSGSLTGARVTIVGNQLRIETTGTFIGEITVRYRIGDGTLDPQRESYGYATVRVRDAPSPPASVSLAAAGAGRITASWELAASNGEPITGYELLLSAIGSGQAPIVVQLGAQSTHTFTTADGVRAGVAYSLQVRAQNVLGWGDFSASSSSATPLDKPTAPQNVTVDSAYTKAGQTTGSLRVSWSPPVSTGGALAAYEVTVVSPQAVAETFTPIRVGADTTVLDVPNLPVPKDGATEFAFTVAAINPEGATVSNFASGTLRYLPIPTAELTLGGLRAHDAVTDTYFFAFRLQGAGFVPELDYEVRCWEGNGNPNAAGTTLIATQLVSGAQLLAGTEPEGCTIRGGEQFSATISQGGEPLLSLGPVRAV